MAPGRPAARDRLRPRPARPAETDYDSCHGPCFADSRPSARRRGRGFRLYPSDSKAAAAGRARAAGVPPPERPGAPAGPVHRTSPSPIAGLLRVEPIPSPGTAVTSPAVRVHQVGGVVAAIQLGAKMVCNGNFEVNLFHFSMAIKRIPKADPVTLHIHDNSFSSDRCR